MKHILPIGKAHVLPPEFLNPQLAWAFVQEPPLDRQLLTMQQAVLAKSEQAGLPVQFLGTMPLFESHRVYSGRQSDWVVVSLSEDPLFRDPDGFPVPSRILGNLQRIHLAGLKFDAIYAAHEVPVGAVREGWPLSPEVLAPPPPKTVERLSRRIGMASNGLWLVATAPALAAAALVGLLAAGAGAVATGAGVAPAGLDPVLLGVIVRDKQAVRHGETGAWFYLGHWTFNTESEEWRR